MTPAASSLSERGARSLTPYDLDRVVAIDSAHTRQSRRRFFEKRLAAAEAQPDSFVHIGLMRGGALRGFLLAHVLRGEFGRNDAIGGIRCDRRRARMPGARRRTGPDRGTGGPHEGQGCALVAFAGQLDEPRLAPLFRCLGLLAIVVA